MKKNNKWLLDSLLLTYNTDNIYAYIGANSTGTTGELSPFSDFNEGKTVLCSPVVQQFFGYY